MNFVHFILHASLLLGCGGIIFIIAAEIIEDIALAYRRNR